MPPGILFFHIVEYVVYIVPTVATFFKSSHFLALNAPVVWLEPFTSDNPSLMMKMKFSGDVALAPLPFIVIPLLVSMVAKAASSFGKSLSPWPPESLLPSSIVAAEFDSET